MANYRAMTNDEFSQLKGWDAINDAFSAMGIPLRFGFKGCPGEVFQVSTSCTWASPQPDDLWPDEEPDDLFLHIDRVILGTAGVEDAGCCTVRFLFEHIVFLS